MISDLELILFQVAEFLEVKDFLSFRIVNKLCYNVSNDILMQQKLPNHCNIIVTNENN
jgi:hypothetical protein